VTEGRELLVSLIDERGTVVWSEEGPALDPDLGSFGLELLPGRLEPGRYEVCVESTAAPEAGPLATYSFTIR
jgi:hypothetical protein